MKFFIFVLIMLTWASCFNGCKVYQSSVKTGDNKTITVGNLIIMGFPLRRAWEINKATGESRVLEVNVK
ncbi:MAG: hypothetical protein MUD12_06490 [Spirochaetes bacterium]|jgi:hypothetical protein|nr:hypothetical protein [Spirochaetota bacterium]